MNINWYLEIHRQNGAEAFADSVQHAWIDVADRVSCFAAWESNSAKSTKPQHDRGLADKLDKISRIFLTGLASPWVSMWLRAQFLRLYCRYIH